MQKHFGLPLTDDRPNLLIVDDEPDMLDFLERVLRRKFSVSRASSAEDALERLVATPYEVLLTDQKMPRVTGLEMLERIRDLYPHMVRVLISGFTDVPDIQRAIDRCGIHNYILKPVDSQRLLEAVDQAYLVRDGAPFQATE
jgi:YesN/AraC family two-component response regulator